MPATAPRFNTVVALDHQRIFVSWFTLLPDDVGGLLIGYRVYYQHDYTGETANVTVTPDKLQVELTDLDPNTYYRIWITAFTTAGEGSGSYRRWRKTCEWSFMSCGCPV